jgi:hypothetical protein
VIDHEPLRVTAASTFVLARLPDHVTSTAAWSVVGPQLATTPAAVLQVTA